MGLFKLLEFGEKLSPSYIWNHFSGPELTWGIFIIACVFLFLRGIVVDKEHDKTEFVISFFSKPGSVSLFIFWTCSIFIFNQEYFLDFVFDKNNFPLNIWKVSMALWGMLITGYVLGKNQSYAEPEAKMKKWAEDLKEKEEELKKDLIYYNERDVLLLSDNQNLKDQSFRLKKEIENLKEQIKKLEESRHVVTIKSSKNDGGFEF